MNEFKPHDYFKADDQGYISRKLFIEHVRNTYDHMRELASLIKGYDQTIDTYLERWDQNLESLDDSIIVLLKEWIDDSTFATIINEEIFKTKADQVDLENVTAQLQQAVGAVTVDSEVVLARGGETTLGQRLDKQGTLLTTLYQEKANKVQEAWITPTLLNGWVVANNNPVGYIKDEMGFVHLKGDIKGGAEAATVIQFPVGYRPKGGAPSYVVTRYSNVIARFIVFENGTTWVRITGGSADATGYSLDGITFRAEG